MVFRQGPEVLVDQIQEVLCDIGRDALTERRVEIHDVSGSVSWSLVPGVVAGSWKGSLHNASSFRGRLFVL